MNITDYGGPWSKERIPLVRVLVSYARHLLAAYDVGRTSTNPVRRAIEMAESWLDHGASGSAPITLAEIRIAAAEAAAPGGGLVVATGGRTPLRPPVGLTVPSLAALSLKAIYLPNHLLSNDDALYQTVVAAHAKRRLEADDVKPEAAGPPPSHLDDLRARMTALLDEVSAQTDRLEDLLGEVETAKGAYEETRENLRAALDSLRELP